MRLSDTSTNGSAFLSRLADSREKATKEGTRRDSNANAMQKGRETKEGRAAAWQRIIDSQFFGDRGISTSRSLRQQWLQLRSR